MEYTIEQAEALAKWATTIIENQQPMPPEIQAFVSDHFWEMIDDSNERQSRVKQEQIISDLQDSELYKTIV